MSVHELIAYTLRQEALPFICNIALMNDKAEEHWLNIVFLTFVPPLTIAFPLQTDLSWHFQYLRTKDLCLFNIKNVDPDKNKQNKQTKKTIAGFDMTSLNFQTSQLLILLRFFFHDEYEQLKINVHTSFRSEWVLSLVTDYAWINKLLRDVAFIWRARELWCWFKRWLIQLSEQFLY